VFPLKDNIGTRRTPVVTIALIIANVVVFFLSLRNGGSIFSGPDAQTVVDYGAIPYELTNPGKECELVSQAGQVLCEGMQGVQGQADAQPPTWLTAFSSMFMHGGLLHIGGNMLFLWVFGNNVEDRMGRLLFLLFYLFCGYVATYGFAYGSADSTTTLVGASGAIAGVLGAYLVVFPRARVTSLVPVVVILFPIRLPAWVVLGGWFLLQWVYSNGTALADGAGVAYLAHVFGFLAGLVVAVLARPALTRVTHGANVPRW
jgi:membrane associated rhomboid family serine protease